MKIDHIGLYVSDLEAAKEFFIKHFGALAGELYHNLIKGFKSYFLTFGDGARLELMTREGIDGSGGALGQCHISFSVGSREAVDLLTARLKADGYTIADGPRLTGDGYYESLILAIDDNPIEITE